MELALDNNLLSGELATSEPATRSQRNLTHGEIDRRYIIRDIDTKEKGMRDFLFTLGCFPGEKITLLSILAENYIIHVKDARYSIDSDLAKTILI